MELSEKILTELQKRLKIGNRRGVHLNAIPTKTSYKFDLCRLAFIDKNLPDNFVKSLLKEQPLKFRISWKNNVPDLNTLLQEDQSQLVSITKSFENLINQTGTIEAEKGINTFGFGFPMLVRRDQADNMLTVAPILIWSLKVKRTKEFNTWEITRTEDDPIYINEVLINHLQNDSKIEIAQISEEMLDDGLIDGKELVEICSRLIETINSKSASDIRSVFTEKLKTIVPIKDKKHYENLPITSNNAMIDFGGLFSIFEVQKQNIINDYDLLMDLKGCVISSDELNDNQFQPLSSVETDPSQQSILHALGTKRNIVIQGPPGTGKSQSLTAVLINALENNKKTIVVCEKRTALEVLEQALIAKGLRHHCVLIKDIVKDRKTVVDSVRDRIDGNINDYRAYYHQHSKETLDEITTKAARLISSINDKHKKLDVRLLPNKTWTDIVGQLIKEKRSNKENYSLAFDKGHFEFTATELNNFLEHVKKGQQYWNTYTPNRQLSFLNSAQLNGPNPFKVEQKILEDFEQYKIHLLEFQAVISQCRDFYSAQRNKELDDQLANVELLKTLSQKVQLLMSSIANYKKDFEAIKTTEYEKQIHALQSKLSEINSFISAHEHEPHFTDEAKTSSLLYKFLMVFSSQRKQTVQHQQELQTLFSQLNELSVQYPEIVSFKHDDTIVQNVANCMSLSNGLDVLKGDLNRVIEDRFTTLNFLSKIPSNCENELSAALQKLATELDSELGGSVHHVQLIDKAVNHMLVVLKNCKDINIMNNHEPVFTQLDQLDNTSIIDNHRNTVAEEFQLFNLLYVDAFPYETELLVDLSYLARDIKQRINDDNWTKQVLTVNSHTLFMQELERILKVQQLYFEHTEDLFTAEFNWFNYYYKLPEEYKPLIDELKGKMDWGKTFLIYYLNSLLVHSADGDLLMDDREHEELSASLKSIEREQMRFIKEYWYSNQLQKKRTFDNSHPDLSVENLYNKRSSHKFQRLSLRMIAQYDIDLFTSFFPIILTTPDVCSNLFKGMNGYFDLVVFDEASQLRLEDNLPAILKGKQVVIAGDEHQMPPSNYFSKIFEGTVDDEEDIDEEADIKIDRDNLLLSCDSLLDFATELNFEKRYLDFHYRSRHPYLIDFSNYAFYNQRLKPIPNDFEYVPIKYQQVGGTFSDHTNEKEADAVLAILEHHIHPLPNGSYPSVGIATFNITQRNLIQSKIQQRQQFGKFEAFNEKMSELEKNGFFVKNLENIQGDERDIIILSTTYGVNKDGKFMQRFGPITHSKGYKLLNVIVTRAKYRVFVCSSIPEDVFMNYKAHLITEQSNNKRAAFFAYLAYAKAVSEQNHEARNAVLAALAENTNLSKNQDQFNGELESPFEEEVYSALADHFETDHIIPQLQFAGFRIDMVFDSRIPGVPKIAIECDGANYHSSQEAYLHDLYRQKILEEHGFVFHRIWSTAWWRNTNRETERLVNFIKQVTNRQTIASQDHSSLMSTFADRPDIILIQSAPEPHTEMLQMEDNLVAEIDSHGQVSLFGDTVTINSVVTIKYLNADKTIKIKLVAKKELAYTVEKDYQNVWAESPLGRCLINNTTGDIVKIGDLDNYVEIVLVNN